MAIKYWWGYLPGSEEDYSVANNWSPNGVPAANDDVVIPAGSADIQYGLDQTAVELDTFEVHDGYSGTIGRPGAYLQIESAEWVNLRGAGDIYLDISQGTCDEVVLKRAVGGAGEYHIIGQDVLATTCVRGRVFAAMGTSGDITITHTTDFAGDSFFTMLSGAVESVNAHAGTTHLVSGSSGVIGGTTNIYDGTIIIDGAFAAGGVDGIRVWGAGTLDYRTTNNPTKIVVAGTGTLTFANDERPKTITTVELYGGPTLNKNNGAGNITITNLSAIGNPNILPENSLQTVTLA